MPQKLLRIVRPPRPQLILCAILGCSLFVAPSFAQQGEGDAEADQVPMAQVAEEQAASVETDQTRTGSNGQDERPAEGDSEPAGESAAEPEPEVESEPEPEPPKLSEIDLTPHFQGPQAVRLRILWSQEKWEEVIASLKSLQAGAGENGPPKSVFRFAIGMAQFKSGLYEEAVESFSSLVGKLPLLDEYCFYYGGKALFALGEHERSSRVLKRVPSSSRLYRRARYSVALSLTLTGETEAAYQLYRKLIESYKRHPLRAEALYYGAANALALGHQGEAFKYFRELYASFPYYWPGAEQQKLLPESVIAAMGGTKTEEVVKIPYIPAQRKRWAPAEYSLKMRIQDLANRARIYYKLRQYRTAIDTFDKVLTFYREDQWNRTICKLRLNRAKAIFFRRKYSDAIEALKPVAENCKPAPELSAEAYYMWGDALKRKAQFEDAVQTLATLRDEFPKSAFADKALYLQAESHRRQNKLAQAVALYRELIENHPKSRNLSNAMWFRAWLHYKTQRYERGLKLFSDIAERFPGSIDAMQARYWSARILQKRGDNEKAVAQYETIIRKRSLSYYALMSMLRLKEIAPDRLPPLVKNYTHARELDLRKELGGLAHAGLAHPHFAKGVALLKFGLFNELAVYEFNAIPSELRKDSAFRWILSMVYLIAEDYHRSLSLPRMRLRREWENKPPEGIYAARWKLAYPLAFHDLVLKYVGHPQQKHPVPSLLLIALMREESSFQPDVESPAKAVGLTQVIPRTGREIAREIEYENTFKPYDLLDPELSIRFGAYYISKLMRKFDGHLHLAIASYNAGPRAAARWLKARGNRPVDEFIEEIPYRETRNYTRRVLKSYGIYRQLYDPDGSGFDLPLTHSEKLLRRYR